MNRKIPAFASWESGRPARKPRPPLRGVLQSVPFSPCSAHPKTAKPRHSVRAGSAGKKSQSVRSTYFTNTIFAILAFAREAAFLWTTPDLTALSIAEV